MSHGSKQFRIGWCISAHGYGHATRSMALMQALGQQLPVHFDILTTVPSWLFAETLTVSHALHPLTTDVGLVQHDPLVTDMPATLRALDGFYPLADERIDQAATLLSGADLVLCDIAPLGIAAAKRAGIPCVLVENFTWDWIYQGYCDQWPQLMPHIAYLRQLYKQADHHIQTVPVCEARVSALTVNPIARPIRNPDQVKARLRPITNQRLVLVAMGGIGGWEMQIAPLLKRKDLLFVLTGRSRENEFVHNLRFLGQDDLAWYHPDLVAASDLVVGKAGYSTVAEVFQAGKPFAYISRPDFRESGPMTAFVDARIDSWEISSEQMCNGDWLNTLPQVSVTPVALGSRENGADQAADYLAALLTGQR